MKCSWRRYAVYFTVIVMESSWLYAILALMNQSAAENRLSVWGLLLVYLLSFGSSKALQHLRWYKPFLTAISWLLWIPVMLLSVKVQLFINMGIADPAWLSAVPQAIASVFYGFRPELLVLMSSAVLWWLGRRLAYLSTEFAVAIAEFQFGLCILLIAFFVGYQLEIDQSGSVFTALLFFASGLVGVSIANAQEGNSWLSGWYQGHWSGLLLVSIALILLVGLFISVIVTPDLLRLFWEGIIWLWGVVERVLLWLASLIPAPEATQPLPTMPAMPGGGAEEEFRMLWQIPEFVLTAMRWGWSIMMGGVLLFTLWRVSSQIFSWLRKRMTSPGAEVESLDGAFKADFLGWLKRILFTLLGIKMRFKPKKKQFLSPEVASVRQLYTQLLHWAAAGGCARHTAQTPYEFMQVLSGVLPEAQGEIDFITRHYVRARYGLAVPVESELHELRQSWHRLRQTRWLKT